MRNVKNMMTIETFRLILIGVGRVGEYYRYNGEHLVATLEG